MVLPEVQRYVVLEGDDVRVIDGPVWMVCLHERSECEGGQRGRKGDRDEEQGNGNTNHGGPTQSTHPAF